MKKRLLSLLCCLTLSAGLCLQPAMAANLPDGWWPVWEKYDNAVSSGDSAAILSAGDAVVSFYADKTMNTDIAEQLYMVYYTRLENGWYEASGDYAAAIENTEALLSVCEYLDSIGRDFTDMEIRCRTHLELLQPFC